MSAGQEVPEKGNPSELVNADLVAEVEDSIIHRLRGDRPGRSSAQGKTGGRIEEAPESGEIVISILPHSDDTLGNILEVLKTANVGYEVITARDVMGRIITKVVLESGVNINTISNELASELVLGLNSGRPNIILYSDDPGILKHEQVHLRQYKVGTPDLVSMIEGLLELNPKDKEKYDDAIGRLKELKKIDSALLEAEAIVGGIMDNDGKATERQTAHSRIKDLFKAFLLDYQTYPGHPLYDWGAVSPHSIGIICLCLGVDLSEMQDFEELAVKLESIALEKDLKVTGTDRIFMSAQRPIDLAILATRDQESLERFYNRSILIRKLIRKEGSDITPKFVKEEILTQEVRDTTSKAYMRHSLRIIEHIKDGFSDLLEEHPAILTKILEREKRILNEIGKLDTASTEA